MRTVYVHRRKLIALISVLLLGGIYSMWRWQPDLSLSAYEEQTPYEKSLSAYEEETPYEKARPRRIHNPKNPYKNASLFQTNQSLDHEDEDENEDIQLKNVALEMFPSAPPLTIDVTSQFPSPLTHIFYYPWYGNPKVDSQWNHWDHEYLKHWDEKQADQWQQGRHVPPNDIGASFYPQLGAYSSRDPKIIDQHMEWIKSAGCGVVVISWYPPDMADQAGEPWDGFMPLYLDAAAKFGLKVTFHIEPYKDRAIGNLRLNVQYLVTKYGKHPAFYRHTDRSHPQPKPLLYVYDSYLIEAKQWMTLLKPDGAETIRGTKYDAYMIGLVVTAKDKTSILAGGFDGFYTYFGADGFSWGATAKNWPSIQVFARKNRLISSISVSPGYDDVRVRPWNAINSRGRREGEYYSEHWQAAIDAKADIVSVTSFNEWHEGTQIEPAIPNVSEEFVYQDYSPHKPEYYLNQTKVFVKKFIASKVSLM